MVRATMVVALTPVRAFAETTQGHTEHSWSSLGHWGSVGLFIVVFVAAIFLVDRIGKAGATKMRPDPKNFPNTPPDALPGGGEDQKPDSEGPDRNWKQRMIKGPKKLWRKILQWLGYGKPSPEKSIPSRFQPTGPNHKLIALMFAVIGTVWTLCLVWGFSRSSWGNFILAVAIVVTVSQLFFRFAGVERRWIWVVAGFVLLAILSGAPPHLPKSPKTASTLVTNAPTATNPVVVATAPRPGQLDSTAIRVTVAPCPSKTTLSSTAGVILVEPGQSFWVRAEGSVVLGGGEYLRDLKNVNRVARDLNITSVEVTPAGGQVMPSWGFPRATPENFAMYGAPVGVPVLRFGSGGNATWVTDQWQRVTYVGKEETCLIGECNFPRQKKLWVLPLEPNDYSQWVWGPSGAYTVLVALEPPVAKITKEKSKEKNEKGSKSEPGVKRS